MPPPMPTFALLDFETTGLSPTVGDCPIEIALVLVRGGRIVHEFAELMKPSRSIPRDVQLLTGITPEMVADARPVANVMRDVFKIAASYPLVAHNAAFDRRFWQAEAQRLGDNQSFDFACTMLLARRFYPELPSHRLSNLVAHHRLPKARAHRALADVHMTYHLWKHMDAEVRQRSGGQRLDFALMKRLQRIKRGELAAFSWSSSAS